MSPILLNDSDVREHLDPASAVSAVRAALVAHHNGTMFAPPRVAADLGTGNLVFTTGHLSDEGFYGFRAYDSLVDAEQVVALWGTPDGALRLLVHGSELGPRRTGSIGAVAVDLLANPGPVRVGLFGAGVEAWTQMWALNAVRPIDEVVVASRRPERTAAFVERLASELGITARTASGPEEAARERDVVILATDSVTPVLRTEWIAPGTHISTLGPKTLADHEFPADLVSRADLVCTDSIAQLAAHPQPHLFADCRVTALGAIAAAAEPGRTDREQITLFSSVGLAGTEVAVAAALWKTVG